MLFKFTQNIININFILKQATGQNCNPSTGLSDGKEDFNSILQKRKMEESKNAKCKVVIRVKRILILQNRIRLN